MVSKKLSFFNLSVTCLVIIATCILHVRMDDQFVCCMKGIKKIRNIELCPVPCCAGYEEKVVYASKLAKITFCEKSPKGNETFPYTKPSQRPSPFEQHRFGKEIFEY